MTSRGAAGDEMPSRGRRAVDPVRYRIVTGGPFRRGTEEVALHPMSEDASRLKSRFPPDAIRGRRSTGPVSFPDPMSPDTEVRDSFRLLRRSSTDPSRGAHDALVINVHS